MLLKRTQLVALHLGILGILVAGFQYLQARKKKRIRRFGVRPINRARRTLGHFRTLFTAMKEIDPEQFFKYTRMTSDQFDNLLELVEPHLRRYNKNKLHLSPAERLAITIHFLSEGCSMQQLAWDYYIGHATVHVIVNETCRVLWDVLQPIYLPAPNNEMEWERISNQFYSRWNIPNCIGAVDGKHVAIEAPANSGSVFFNYKKHFSIVLMAACDAYYRFTMVDVGAAGGNHDSYVFRESAFGKALLNGQLGLPHPCPLPNTNINVPYFLVGDAAFPLHTNLMRPYPGDHLDDMQRIFNYRLSRARRIIENTFGILVQRWRILRRTIIANVDNCEAFIKATIVLHNYVQKKEEQIPEANRQYCPTGFVDYEDQNGVYHRGLWRRDLAPLRPIGRLASNNSARSVRERRDSLANWFISPQGALPWQWDRIYEGGLPEL